MYYGKYFFTMLAIVVAFFIVSFFTKKINAGWQMLFYGAIGIYFLARFIFLRFIIENVETEWVSLVFFIVGLGKVVQLYTTSKQSKST